jgi:hypothetical protein
MTRTLAAALTALALTGCAGMAADTCQTFGYDPGTDAFLKCAQTEMTSMRADTMSFYKETMNRLTDAYANSQNEPGEQGKPSEQGKPGDQAQAEEQ